MKEPSPALLARVIDGDRSAQSALLEEHHDFIRRMLFRLVGPSSDLDDLQQTVMMRLLQSLHRYRATSAFRTWVGSLCVHVARDALRRQRTRGEAVQPEDVGLRDGDDPHATIAARQQLACCRRALNSLSTEQRMAFVLRVLDGHSVDEVAALMNSARSTTRMRLYWGKKAFARALAAEGVELPAHLTEDRA
ncbi:MAG: RNA polymerase sigma factor [Archangium sp.]|nr:RNA polymerase sigma factor [Archangium sp.]